MIDMEDINRLKLVLVEKKKTSKWLAEQLKKILQPYQNGVLMFRSLIWLPFQNSRIIKY